jgi:hypothetical protein
MSAAQFRLGESIGQRLSARGDAREAIADSRAHGSGPSPSTRIPAGDGPLALDPLSPIAFEPGPAELTGPLALDPLSPIGPDAT